MAETILKENTEELAISSKLLNAVIGCLVELSLCLHLSLLGMICSPFPLECLFLFVNAKIDS